MECPFCAAPVKATASQCPQCQRSIAKALKWARQARAPAPAVGRISVIAFALGGLHLIMSFAYGVVFAAFGQLWAPGSAILHLAVAGAWVAGGIGARRRARGSWDILFALASLSVLGGLIGAIQGFTLGMWDAILGVCVLAALLQHEVRHHLVWSNTPGDDDEREFSIA